MAAIGYFLGRRRPMLAAATDQPYHSTPDYYGWYVVVWMFAPPLLASVIALGLHLAGVWTISSAMVMAGWLALPAVAIFPVLLTIHADLRARNIVERVIYIILFSASLISILTTLGIIASVLFEAIHFFTHKDVSIVQFFTGTKWDPDTAFLGGADAQHTATPKFGALPLFWGTFLITTIAMAVAVPLGVLSAIYMAEYAPRSIRRIAKPVLEILAGIPTVVYGFFAALTVSPLIVACSNWFDANVLGTINHWMGWTGEQAWHLNASFQNALSPGLIMGIMIVPFMSSLSDDVISAVPQNLRRGAMALGSTRSEVIKRVVLPAALPGITSAFLISVSRAVGETMIVAMAASLQANITANPLHEVTTVTVRMVDALVGDQAFDSAETLSAFGLGLTLLMVTLMLNVISAVVIRKFRQRYE